MLVWSTVGRRDDGKDPSIKRELTSSFVDAEIADDMKLLIGYEQHKPEQ